MLVVLMEWQGAYYKDLTINKGENNMKKITEVTQMTGSAEGLSLLIDSWRNQIAHDQQYREFTQNSIESIKRVQ